MNIIKGWLISILFCAFINAIILGPFSNIFLPGKPGMSLLRIYAGKFITAFAVEITFMFWIAYLLFIIVFVNLAHRSKRTDYGFYGLLGGALGVAGAAVFVVVHHEMEPIAWYGFPNVKNWITVPTYGIVGTAYGLFYRKWFLNRMTL